jgi:hypothetical protein
MTAVCMTTVLCIKKALPHFSMFVSPVGWRPLVPFGIVGDRRRCSIRNGVVYRDGKALAAMAYLGWREPGSVTGVELSCLHWFTPNGKRFICVVEMRKKPRRTR